MKNDDYLWDKSGVPDPEIAHLEQLLGQYRQRTGASVLPMRPRKIPYYRLAAAAVLLLACIPVGWWLTRQPAPTTLEVAQQPLPASPQVPATPPDRPVSTQATTAPAPRPPRPSYSKRTADASSPSHRVTAPTLADLADAEATGEAAKARLILALQITSSTLNEVQEVIRENLPIKITPNSKSGREAL